MAILSVVCHIHNLCQMIKHNFYYLLARQSPFFSDKITLIEKLYSWWYFGNCIFWLMCGNIFKTIQDTRMVISSISNFHDCYWCCQESCRAPSHSGFQRSSWSSPTCVFSVLLSDRPSSYSLCRCLLDRRSNVSTSLYLAVAAQHWPKRRRRRQLAVQTVCSRLTLSDQSVGKWDVRIKLLRRSAS